ncbi:MAG: hypothetical protein ACYDBJ_24120 [Aggregatilineales bacterium]
MLLASPTLYSGQIVEAGLCADSDNCAPVTCQLYIDGYGAGDQVVTYNGSSSVATPGMVVSLKWQIPDLDGMPIARIGVALSSEADHGGSVYLDYLTWDGAPNVILKRPAHAGTMWRAAWVDGTDQTEPHAPEAYRVVQNRGTGLLIQGTREWRNYEVSATLTPHLVSAAGIAARVQGVERYYGLLLCADGTVCLVRALDGQHILASKPFAWEFGKGYTLSLRVEGLHLQARIEGEVMFEIEDSALDCGGIALICREGRVATEFVSVCPIA